MLRRSIIASYQTCSPVSSSVFLWEQCQQCQRSKNSQKSSGTPVTWLESFHRMVNITVAEWTAILSMIISDTWFDSWYKNIAEKVKYKGIAEILNKIDGPIKPNECFKQIRVYKEYCACSETHFSKVCVYCLPATYSLLEKSQSLTQNSKNEHLKLITRHTLATWLVEVCVARKLGKLCNMFQILTSTEFPNKAKYNF